jgi:PhzF family phenazine biosynthesis protein
MTIEIQRLSAFPFEGKGGNPAGVVLRAEGLTQSKMQEIAAEVGYSETVFVTSRDGLRLRVRYFSPEMEVDFCGHATIAAGVALGNARGAGAYVFDTNTGDVNVNVTSIVDGFAAELTSHQGTISPIHDEVLTNLLAILGWPKSVASNRHLPMIANAGNSHPIIVLNSPERLQNLEYEFEALKEVCRANKWPTLQLIAQEADGVWRSRNPFAFGGVYEDPATGSAAAAFGVYLRETGAAAPGDTLIIKQGFEMGQPCLLNVTIGSSACTVSGTAIQITE